MFDDFIKEVKEKDETIEYKELNLSKNILFNPNLAVNMLENIDDYSDKQIFDMIKESYETIFSERFVSQDPRRITLMINSRFISEAVKVFSLYPDISYSTLVYINKIIFDFNDRYTGEEYESQRNLFISLARAINKRKIQELVIIGLPEVIAVNLAYRRYSSNNESINIRRLLSFMASVEPGLMTAQMVVNIYERLFEEIGLLFQIIMTEPLRVTSFDETYENIGLAILAMVDNMPAIAIQRVLRGYSLAIDSGALKYGQDKTYIRYYLSSLVGYDRIVNAVIYLKEYEGVRVP